MRLENLADVHARRHSERVENDLDRSPVGQIRHVLFGQNARDDALVPVASGHLVADRQFALHRDEDLDHLDHARRQLVALLDLVYLLLIEVFENGDLAFGALFEVLDLGGDVARSADLDPLERADVHAFQHFSRQLGAFDGDGARAENQVGFELAPFEQFVDAFVALLFEDADFVGQVLPHLLLFGGLYREAADVLVLTLAGEDLDVDNGALDAGRAGQGRVAHVAGLLAEDRAEEFLLGGQLSLALRRDLADQDRAGLDVGADADDAALVEVAQRGLADVRDVARDLFGAEFGVAGLDLELFDMDRGVVIAFHHLLGDQDLVLEVVTAPRHERPQHVSAQRQFAAGGPAAVGDHVALLDARALLDDRLLVDAGVLVRAFELDQRVYVRRHFARERAVDVVIDADDDALGVHDVDDPVTLGDDHRARILRGDGLHAGADQRRLGPQQRHGLALHVRPHQRAVGVVVLEEGDQAGRDRDELFRADVHELHLLAHGQNEFAGLPRVDAFAHQVEVLVEFDVRLADDVFVFLPGREVERIRLIGRRLLAVAQPLVGARGRFFRHVVVRLELGVARVRYLHVIYNAAALDLAVRRLDEAELVDPREAGERRNQADVRTFRRLDRADAAVMRRMHVAHLEPRALARDRAGTGSPAVRPRRGRAGCRGGRCRRRRNRWCARQEW